MERVLGAISLRDKLSQIEREAMPTALARANNRIAGTIKARTASDIALATGLGVRSVSKRIALTKKASKADPSAVLEITGRPLNLVEFVVGKKRQPKSPKSPKRHVRMKDESGNAAEEPEQGGVTANAWGRKRKYPGVFLAKMPNGKVIAVKRSAGGKTRDKLIASGKWADKSPHIEAVFGAGIAREAAQKALAQQRQATLAERMPIELRAQLRYAMQQMLVRKGRAQLRGGK